MGCTNIALILLCFTLGLTICKPCVSCCDLCKVKREGRCEVPKTMGTDFRVSLFDRQVPCATCNLTEQVRETPLRCVPGDLVMLQVAGHWENGAVETLPGLSSLHTLVLGPGNIQTATARAFSGLPILTTLTMNRNSIQTVGTWFGLISKLVKLYLSWNDIEDIEEGALQPLIDLRHLELTHNRLREVKQWHFKGLRSLKCLKLSHNNISHIDEKSFIPLISLRKVFLDHNKLALLEVSWMKELRSNTFVHLEHNLMQTINISHQTLDVMSGRYVYVKGNPFRCTCALDSLKSKGSKALRDYQSLQCSFPPGLLGRKIAEIQSEKMSCLSPSAEVFHKGGGATLVCDVFWEKQPKVLWFDPRGNDVGRRESCEACGNITTHWKTEIPTRKSPEHGAALSTNSSGLPYFGRTTYSLTLSPLAHSLWTEGSFRCIVRSAAGSVFANLTLNKSTSGDQTRGEGTLRDCSTIKGGEGNSRDCSTINSGEGNSRDCSTIINGEGTSSRDCSTVNGGEGTSRNCSTEHSVRFAFSEKHNSSKRQGPSEHSTKLVAGNTTIVKGTNKTTDKNSTTPDPFNHTVMAASNTSTPSRQHNMTTQRIIILLNTMDQTLQKDDSSTSSILMSITSVSLALFVLGGMTSACHKCYKRRQQRHHVEGNAGNAGRDTHQQPSPGNPAAPQCSYEEIPDDISTDITPYATTVDMVNPMYDATSTEPKGLVTSHPGPPHQDPPLLPKRHTTQKPSPEPQGMATSSLVPCDPPPQSNRHTTYTPSSQPQGTESSQSGTMPRSPPRPDRRINYPASTRPLSSDAAEMGRMQDQPPLSNKNIPYGASSDQTEMGRMQDQPPLSNRPVPYGASSDQTEMGRMQDQPPLSNRPVPYGASSEQSSEITLVQEIQDPTPRPKRHINSPGASSQLQGLQLPSAEEVPDLPPRSNKYVNSNVPAQQQS